MIDVLFLAVDSTPTKTNERPSILKAIELRMMFDLVPKYEDEDIVTPSG